MFIPSPHAAPNNWRLTFRGQGENGIEAGAEPHCIGVPAQGALDKVDIGHAEQAADEAGALAHPSARDDSRRDLLSEQLYAMTTGDQESYDEACAEELLRGMSSEVREILAEDNELGPSFLEELCGFGNPDASVSSSFRLERVRTVLNNAVETGLLQERQRPHLRLELERLGVVPPQSPERNQSGEAHPEPEAEAAKSLPSACWWRPSTWRIFRSGDAEPSRSAEHFPLQGGSVPQSTMAERADRIRKAVEAFNPHTDFEKMLSKLIRNRIVTAMEIEEFAPYFDAFLKALDLLPKSQGFIEVATAIMRTLELFGDRRRPSPPLFSTDTERKKLGQYLSDVKHDERRGSLLVGSRMSDMLIGQGQFVSQLAAFELASGRTDSPVLEEALTYQDYVPLTAEPFITVLLSEIDAHRGNSKVAQTAGQIITQTLEKSPPKMKIDETEQATFDRNRAVEILKASHQLLAGFRHRGVTPDAVLLDQCLNWVRGFKYHGRHVSPKNLWPLYRSPVFEPAAEKKYVLARLEDNPSLGDVVDILEFWSQDPDVLAAVQREIGGRLKPGYTVDDVDVDMVRKALDFSRREGNEWLIDGLWEIVLAHPQANSLMEEWKRMPGAPRERIVEWINQQVDAAARPPVQSSLAVPSLVVPANRDGWRLSQSDYGSSGMGKPLC